MRQESDNLVPLVEEGNLSKNPEVMKLRILFGKVLCALATLFMFSVFALNLWAGILDLESGVGSRLAIIKPLTITMITGFFCCLVGAGMISVRNFISISKIIGIGEK